MINNNTKSKNDQDRPNSKLTTESFPTDHIEKLRRSIISYNNFFRIEDHKEGTK